MRGTGFGACRSVAEAAPREAGEFAGRKWTHACFLVLLPGGRSRPRLGGVAMAGAESSAGGERRVGVVRAAEVLHQAYRGGAVLASADHDQGHVQLAALGRCGPFGPLAR